MDVIRVTKVRMLTVVCSCNNSFEDLSMLKNFCTSVVGGYSWFVLKLRSCSIKHLIYPIITTTIILIFSHRCSSLLDCLIVMRPHIIAWHENKLAKVQCQHPLVLTKSISTSAAWALHTLIELSRECTINKFLSLIHPFSCVSPTFLPTTVHPPTALINHSRGKIFIQSRCIISTMRL
jgi:hypothetical protein